MTLTHCPRCDYSLEGLPEVHPCPECGLVCDRGAEVFDRSALQDPLLVVFMVAGVNLFVAAGIGSGGIASSRFAAVAGAFTGVLTFVVVACGVLLFRRMRKTRGPRGLVVLPGGLALKALDGSCAFYGWPGLHAVEARARDRSVWLKKGVEGERLRGFFKDEAALDRFMSHVQRSRSAWQEREGAST